MIRKKILIASVLTGVLMLSAFVPYNKYFDIARNLDIYATLFKELNTYYVDEVDPGKIIKTSIDAMLVSLDPYTSYIPEEGLDDYRTMTTGQYAGIGSMIGQMKGKTIITMPTKGFPAEKAGLKIGDEIVEIDNVPTLGKESGAVSNMLKGTAGTEVIVTIKRFNQPELMDITIKRARITLDNVAYVDMIKDNIGYIRLTDFTTNAGKEIKQAVHKLKSKGAENIILDLRGNPGGLLHEAVNICNVFIPKGKVVVETKGKQEQWNQVYKTLNNPTDTDIPLVVLTNNGSASASEIVAGTFQDYDRAVLIGRKTYGKGLVQTTRPLAFNTQLKVTTAKYYTPSGRCIQAIDYSHKNKDGSSDKIADSLKVAFQTTNGRIVYDGGGIDPDIKMKPIFLASVTVSLMNSGMVFDYATKYFYEHKNIASAKDFKLTDSEYKDFLKWLDSKNFTYESRAKRAIDKFEETVKSEGYFDELGEEINSLKEDIKNNQGNELITYKDEILSFLNEQIVSRYYLSKGEIAASLGEDLDVKEAIKVLSTPADYQRVLQAKK